MANGNRRRSPKSRKGSKSSGTKSIVKALSDLKTDTQVRGSPRLPDIPRSFVKRSKVYTINQTYSLPPISIVAAVSTAGATVINFNQLPLATSLGTVFDAYRFQQCTVRFVPLGPLPLSGGFNPLLTVIDYDDAVVLTSTAAAQAYDTCQETPLSQYCERTFIPKSALAAYSGAFTSFNQATNQWFDMASPGVLHYGVKWYIFGTTSTYAGLYAVEVDCVINLRQIR